MKTPTCVVASFALVLAMGCGSVTSGGDGGTDGAAGTTGGAGTTGSAGHGGAGTTGSAGHGGTGGTGPTCADLQSMYGEALTAARMCTAGAANQCAHSVSSSLSPCFSNCTTYVNDATALDAIKAMWTAAGCANQGPIACPAIACIQPVMGNCVATDGGGATCSSSGIGPIGATTN